MAAPMSYNAFTGTTQLYPFGLNFMSVATIPLDDYTTEAFEVPIPSFNPSYIPCIQECALIHRQIPRDERHNKKQRLCFEMTHYKASTLKDMGQVQSILDVIQEQTTALMDCKDSYWLALCTLQRCVSPRLYAHIIQIVRQQLPLISRLPEHIPAFMNLTTLYFRSSGHCHCTEVDIPPNASYIAGVFGFAIKEVDDWPVLDIPFFYLTFLYDVYVRMNDVSNEAEDCIKMRIWPSLKKLFNKMMFKFGVYDLCLTLPDYELQTFKMDFTVNAKAYKKYFQNVAINEETRQVFFKRHDINPCLVEAATKKEGEF